MGSYEILLGGMTENSLLFFSGGIFDSYIIHTENMIKHIFDKQINLNPIELYEIFEATLKRDFIIECCTTRETSPFINVMKYFFLTETTSKFYSIYQQNHSYLITDVKEVDSEKFVKMHNPYNEIHTNNYTM